MSKWRLSIKILPLIFPRWILLCFKREFPETDALKIWESCWSHYQTDYFHLFICVAIVSIYGDDVIDQGLPSDEILLHFSSLAMHMNGQLVLRKVTKHFLFAVKWHALQYPTNVACKFIYMYKYFNWMVFLNAFTGAKFTKFKIQAELGNLIYMLYRYTMLVLVYFSYFISGKRTSTSLQKTTQNSLHLAWSVLSVWARDVG